MTSLTALFIPIGIELTMRLALSTQMVLSGNAMPHETPVFIEGRRKCGRVQDTKARKKITKPIIPLLGRLVSIAGSDRTLRVGRNIIEFIFV